MAIAKIKAVLNCDIKKVWETVTSLENYRWRSDLSKVEITGNGKFTEYTKSGYPTFFTIISVQPLKRWEFDMENGNIKGRWTGVFHGDDKQTEIEFTEDVTAKKLIMKPFVKAYRKKQQAQYVEDLRKAVER